MDTSPSPLPPLLRTKAMAARLGLTPQTLWAWSQTDPKLADCRFRRGWWRAEKTVAYLAGMPK
jgi:hypothetical protein